MMRQGQSDVVVRQGSMESSSAGSTRSQDTVKGEDDDNARMITPKKIRADRKQM